MPRKRISENDLVVSAAAPPRRKPAIPKRAKHSASPAEKPSHSAAAAVCEPSPDDIARLAYSFWEARGYAGGSSEEDWLRAERELRGN
jgi:hypothetical protein